MYIIYYNRGSSAVLFNVESSQQYKSKVNSVYSKDELDAMNEIGLSSDEILCNLLDKERVNSSEAAYEYFIDNNIKYRASVVMVKEDVT